MSAHKFAIITPSYAPDFARCRLLSQSIEQYISPSTTHYIIVDQQDLALFQQLSKPNTEIITKESLLPWWIKRIPLKNNWWFSFKTLPIRGWIIQQIIKIAIAHHIQEDVLVFVDSDVAFVRPTNLSDFSQENKVRFFRLPGKDNLESHYKYHLSTCRLLGLPPTNYLGARYISQIISWKRDNVLKLCAHLEKVSGKNWLETLGNSLQLSEYILYGAFIDHILKEESGHYEDERILCHEYWDPEPMSSEELNNFWTEISPEHLAVMISAKAGIPVEDYEKFLSSSSQSP